MGTGKHKKRQSTDDALHTEKANRRQLPRAHGIIITGPAQKPSTDETSKNQHARKTNKSRLRPTDGAGANLRHNKHREATTEEGGDAASLRIPIQTSEGIYDAELREDNSNACPIRITEPERYRISIPTRLMRNVLKFYPAKMIENAQVRIINTSGAPPI